MESFWQGALVKQVFREKKDLMVCGETIRLPCAKEIILERQSPNFSKDVKLDREKVSLSIIEKNMLNKYFLLGVEFNPEMKRNEIIQIALPDGWCWDET